MRRQSTAPQHADSTHIPAGCLLVSVALTACAASVLSGRTARAGASGVALSLVAPSELSLVSLIQKAQDEKAQSEAAHVASDAVTDTASVSIALPS
eukprot:COSAG02_NODE_1744_length_11100_cov_6.084083_12_plen_96_part_00